MRVPSESNRRFSSATLLHDFVAQLCCRTLLHDFVARLRCTALLHNLHNFVAELCCTTVAQLLCTTLLHDLSFMQYCCTHQKRQEFAAERDLFAFAFFSAICRVFFAPLVTFKGPKTLYAILRVANALSRSRRYLF
jgi:hypothetical protein